MKKYSNLIGGKEFSLSGKTFIARSQFYPDYQFTVSDANEIDIDRAANYAKKASGKLRQLGYLRRKEILKRTAEKIKFDQSDLEHCVKMMGMPFMRIQKYVSEIPILLGGYSDALETRTQLVNGQIGRIFNDSGYLEIKEPLDGFIYSIVPSNDPRALSFVFSVVGTLGIPALLKVSKNELPIAHKIAKTVIQEGYPADALNLLCWDTDDNERARKMHFYILNRHEPTFFMPFGNDNTVDEQLRFETRRTINPSDVEKYIGKTLDEKIIEELTKTEKIDRLTGNVFRHTSGNCAIIVDGFTERGVNLAGFSAFEYPISCKSAKSAYFVGSKEDFETFKKELSSYASKLVMGDPLNPETQVGYVDKDSLDQILGKVGELTKLGQIEIVFGGKRINEFQTSPLILATDDPESPLLTKENSVYILTLKRTDSLEQAVDECNIPGFKERLAVSIITDKEGIDLASTVVNLRCDQCHIDQPTRFLHPPIHQAVSYPDRMTRSKSIFLGDKIHKVSFPSDEIKKEYTILFVDDEPDIARNTTEEITLAYESDSEFRKRKKIKTIFVNSGEVAIRTAERNLDISLVVTDMRMGGINGGATLQRIKEIIPGVKGIVVSAYSDTKDLEDARLAGVTGERYIKKQDYNPDKLWNVIKSCFA